METVNVVVGKVIDLLFVAVGRQVNYLFQYKDNVNNLKQKVEDLKGARQRIKGRIDEANRKGEIIEAEVETWITSVDVLTPEAERFLASEDDAAKKNVCFNLRPRYKSSKKATKMTSLVDQLLAKGDKFATVPVSRRAPPPGIDAYESKNIDAYKFQSSAMKEVMDALKDEKNHILGVCGIGGVGKTTLVREVGKRVKESKQFDEVVMAVVSQPINKERIQDGIARMLGMGPLPEDNESRRGGLWERIKKEKKILVILDDIWSGLNLEELGIPVGSHGSSYCQIILTSRRKDVCEEMEAQKIITVTPLPDDDAWSLFKTVAGEIIEMDSEINQIAIKVAKECGGLPIAILAVGRAMRNKKSKVEWEDAYRQLEKASPPTVDPMLKDVFPKLKLSYEYLKDQDAKSCFLLCCMFPEDYEIPVELLAEYGMGLRLFRDSRESLQEARLGARNAVNTLKGSCLLLDGKDNDHVKMHDVVRDVAIVIASEDERSTFLVKTGLGWKEWLEGHAFDKYVGISLMQNDIAKLPVELELLKLQILLLRSNTSLSEIPNEFLERMKNLKVIDLGECRISSLPRSLSLLTTLRSLHLDGSKFNEMSNLEGLKKLEILSVFSTDITEIPEQIGSLTNIRFLDMRKCGKLSYIPAGVISSLHKLEDLYVGDSFVRWDVHDVEEESNQRRKNASLKELQSLSKLRFLDIVVPDIKVLPRNLQLKSLQRFMITIESRVWHLSTWIEYPDCSILDLSNINVPVLGWIKNLIDAAEYLILFSIKNLRNVVKDLNGVGFNKNRFLHIIDCDDVSCLADTADLELKSAFSNLEKLRVKDLYKFTEICHGGQLLSTGGSFRKLREISIYWCGNMSYALGFNMLIALQNLTKLEVSDSYSIEYILGSMWPVIYKPGEEEEEEEEEILPMLKDVVLCSLSNLVDIWNGHHGKFVSHLESIRIDNCNKLRRVFDVHTTYLKDHIVVFSLKSIYIWGCGSLEHIIILEPELVGTGRSRIHGALHSPCFQYLESVRLSFCGKLRYVFSPSIAEGLSQLKELEVEFCEKLEAIIIGGGLPEESEGGDENVIEASSSSSTSRTEPKPEEKKMKMVFPSLSSIKLWQLNSLKSFCSVPNYTSMEYPSLDYLRIIGCPALESWGFGIQDAPNLKPDKIKISDCGGFALTKSDDGRELIVMAPAPQS